MEETNDSNPFEANEINPFDDGGGPESFDEEGGDADPSNTNPFDGDNNDDDTVPDNEAEALLSESGEEETAPEGVVADSDPADNNNEAQALLTGATGGTGFLAKTGQEMDADDVDDEDDDGAVDPIEHAPTPAARTMSHLKSAKEMKREDEINFVEDDKRRDMTFGRRIALNLMKYNWYYPKHKEDETEGIVDHGGGSDGNEHEMATLEQPDDSSNNNNDNEAYVHASVLQHSARQGSTAAYPFLRARKGTPSLEKAWAYFEHFTLPRYVVGKQDSDPEENNNKEDYVQADEDPNMVLKKKKQKQDYNRAEPGEKYLQTKLYNPFCTPHQELGDWGIGIGLYFTTMLVVGLVTLVAGLVSLPNILYFASDDYDGQSQTNVTSYLKGSAICTDTTWVPCPGCTENDFPDGRVGVGTNVDDPNTTAIFALKNNCEGATVTNGIVNIVVLGVVIFGILLMNWFVVRAEVAFDEDEQTAQDYSICIRNPPADAKNPEEWKAYFEQVFGAQVTVCTIGVDNDLLVQSLVTRRENLKKIEIKVEPGTSLDTLTIAGIAAEEELKRKFFGRLFALMAPGIPEHFAKVVVATARIQGLAQRDHPCSNVFITFETEADQRRVLEALSIGKHAAKKNHTAKAKDPRHLFRGERVLRVTEPDEPDSIRWSDLNARKKDRMKQQFFTVLTTLICIAASTYIVRACNDVDVAFSAFAIAAFNIAFPMFAKFLTSVEAHASEGGKQRSLYFKVALFRWVNTAVVITIITPFTETLMEEDGLIQQVFALFFAEIVTNTAIQLGDIGGHISRHFLAPRAKNQDAMDLAMQGSDFDLSERYTGMTKILLLAVWYNAIFPATLFLCSITLFINYFVDRFSLMRTWKRVPALGPRISAFSRKYFFSAALVAMALLSSYYWSGFPFDNLCDQETSNNALSGTWVVDPKGSEDDVDDEVRITVASSDDTYFFCRQDFFRYYSGYQSFPFTSKNQRDGFEWMTDDQEKVTNMWGIVSLVVIGGVALKFIISWIQGIHGYYYGDYSPRGEDQNKPFSKEESISAYIPQIVSPVFSYPLLATNMDGVDVDLLDWTDSHRPHSFYDLTKDAQFLLQGTDIASTVSVFSKVAHWPPEQEGSEQQETMEQDSSEQQETMVAI